MLKELYKHERVFLLIQNISGTKKIGGKTKAVLKKCCVSYARQLQDVDVGFQTLDVHLSSSDVPVGFNRLLQCPLVAGH